MIFKKGYLKLIRTYRAKEEFLLGKLILKKNKHAAPDFMIIGAVKAGTTSLFQYLSQHPEIIPSKEKELLYFTAKQEKGLKWYLSNFPLKSKKKGRLTFEATPSYMYYEKVIKSIAHLFPDMKLIISLRDPVKRAFSQWNFYHDSSFMRKYSPLAKDNRTFKESIEQELKDPTALIKLHRYIYRSLYAQHLKKIYKYFSPEQVLLLDFDELKTAPKKTLKEVTDFLNIESVYSDFTKSAKTVDGVLQTKDEESSKDLKVYNINKYKVEIEPETEKKLRTYFKKEDEELIELTGKKFKWMD